MPRGPHTTSCLQRISWASSSISRSQVHTAMAMTVMFYNEKFPQGQSDENVFGEKLGLATPVTVRKFNSCSQLYTYCEQLCLFLTTPRLTTLLSHARISTPRNPRYHHPQARWPTRRARLWLCRFLREFSSYSEELGREMKNTR